MSEQELQVAELKEKATQYVQYKNEIAPIEKKCKALNTSIKSLMEVLKVDDVQLDDGSTLKYTISKSESLDEEKLIKQLKHFAPFTQCIKTKEYIDMDILESEIYHGDLSDDALCAMDSCRKTKEIVKLEIKKGKK
jgi:hypothetical protein